MNRKIYYRSLTSKGLEKPELPVSSRIPLILVKKLLNNIPNAIICIDILQVSLLPTNF